jgi:hypothetical protein
VPAFTPRAGEDEPDVGVKWQNQLRKYPTEGLEPSVTSIQTAPDRTSSQAVV